MNAKKTLAFLLTLVMLVSLMSGFSVMAEEAAEPITADTTWYTSTEAGQEYTITTPPCASCVMTFPLQTTVRL